jgi:hypothetical protein
MTIRKSVVAGEMPALPMHAIVAGRDAGPPRTPALLSAIHFRDGKIALHTFPWRSHDWLASFA